MRNAIMITTRSQAPLKAILFSLTLMLMAHHGYSQSRQAYIPEHGFWQLVNEKGQKDVTIVQFYTDDRRLMYEEKVKGIHFNMKKVKTFRWLKEGLDKATITWNERQKAVFNQDWMAAIAKR